MRNRTFRKHVELDVLRRTVKAQARRATLTVEERRVRRLLRAQTGIQQ